MKNLMTTNVYDIQEEFVVMGSCMASMQPLAYSKLQGLCSNIYEICLEQEHINMAITKLAGMIARNDIRHIIFASVDRSPHCTQLHYIAEELLKITNKDTKITHYVAVDNGLIEISNDTIKLSKSLSELENINK